MTLLLVLLLLPVSSYLSNESFSIQFCLHHCRNSTDLPAYISQLPLIDNQSSIILDDLPSPRRPSILFHGMHASDSHIGSMLPTMKSMASGIDADVHLQETHFRPNRYSLPSGINHTFISIDGRNREQHDRPYILMSTTLPTIHWQSMMALGPSLLSISDYSISRLVSHATYYSLDDVNYFAYPSPLGHDVVHVGLSCSPQGKQLPLEYESFIASNYSKGVINIAFGSNVPWKFAPAHHMRVFVQGLNYFRDHRVIFSFNGRPDQLVGLGDHVMVTKWAPQKEILSDERTKLYITHGGLKSMKESVCPETPVLFMPLFAEQSHNAHLAHKEGFGEILFKVGRNISHSTSDFIDKVHRLLSQPIYKQRAMRFKQFILERPLSAESTVSFHTRRALTKHRELNQFKRVGQFISYSAHFYLPHIGGIVVLLFILSR